MKKMLVTMSSLVLIVLLQSCTTQSIFYHSEASLPYYHRSIKTKFTLIKDQNATNTFQFGVIAAKDNDTLSYVLIAPSKELQFVTTLTDVNLNFAIPILPAQVKEFISILNSTADNWNTKFDTKEGIGYEFMVAPENKIIPKSENVAVWYSTFRFYFQNNYNGPLGSVLMGEGIFQYYYRLEKLSEIKDLSSMLSLAIK